MTYKQIMRHSSCRELMRQDLEAAERPHRHGSHASKKHRDTGHSHKAKRHRH